MQNITENSNKCNSNSKEKCFMVHFCDSCQRYIKISQIQQKRVNKSLTFNILIFYCRKCDVYYIVFKFMNDNNNVE